ncbi:hypothetical protein [Pseudomonas granadensis]
MSKFFEELMESLREMDEILRSERRTSYPTSTPKTLRLKRYYSGS